MEELELIVEMIAKLPQTALWVLVGFWAYKVIIIGSVYGLIRFAIDKLHSWLMQRKLQPVDVRLVLDGHCIEGTKEGLIVQLERVKRATGRFVHDSDVEWLRQAIDDKIAKDGK